MPPISPPKIKDVARIAGVSTATVSRTLSKPETVAETTRKAVLAAAEQTGYRVNLAARNLRNQRTGAVMVLVPNLGNPFFSQILAGIEQTLAQNQLSVVMVDTQQPNPRPEHVFDYLHHSRADGIICLDGTLPIEALPNGASARRRPLVFACEWQYNDAHPAVRVDNAQGAKLAIDHLVGLGHRDIGYINGPAGNVLSTARYGGTVDALRQHQLELRPQWVFDGDFSLDAGIQAARSWLALTHRPTALFCANDETAIGLISELHRNGIDVPGQVSVVGFDDIDIARCFIPALTTIRQPRQALGGAAAQLLLDTIAQPVGFMGGTTEVLPVELIQRHSSVAPV